MNIYYPSILIFTLALILVYWLVPRFTPLIMVILAGGLLTFGVYHHYILFRHEYQKTTWTESLKIYAPAVLIGFTIMFILFGIFSFFSTGAVPIPDIPATAITNILSPPNPSNNLSINVLGSPVTAAINAVTNVTNTVSSGITDTFKNVTNTVTNTLSNVTNTLTGNTKKNNTTIF